MGKRNAAVIAGAGWIDIGREGDPPGQASHLLIQELSVTCIGWRRGSLVFRPDDRWMVGDGPVLTQAAVSSVSYHGHDTLLAASAGDQEILIRVLGRQSVTAGDDVTVRVARPGVFFA